MTEDKHPITEADIVLPEMGSEELTSGLIAVAGCLLGVVGFFIGIGTLIGYLVWRTA